MNLTFRWHINLLAILLVFVLSFLFIGCKPSASYHKINGQTMGTYYAITFKGNQPEIVKKQVEQILLDFNNSVSTYIPESTISRLNTSATGIFLPENDPYFKPVYEKASQLFTETSGDLNTAIAPLVNYWGFGYKGKDQITKVDSMKVDSLLNLVRQTSVTIEEKVGQLFIAKSPKEAAIDYSSLAKGYGIDVLADYFDENGVEHYLIDIGGEARAKGNNPKNALWTLAINKPKEDAAVDDLEIILTLDNKALATSGNYRIYYENEGRKFAHIVNPQTGYSALSNLLSASVIAEDCMTADGIATALMVKGLEGAKEFLSQTNYPACLIYDGDGDDKLEKFYINGFEQMVVHEQ